MNRECLNDPTAPNPATTSRCHAEALSRRFVDRDRWALGMLRYFSIFLVLIPSLIRAADDSAAAKNFERYLTDCGTNEIRCIWFLYDEPNVGMVMAFSLRDYTVFTAREVYNEAIQTSETRKLTDPQVLNLQKIVEQLPASDERVEFKRAVSVSTRRGGKVEVFHYDRQHAPALIQRLYDIGGAYFYDGKGA